MTNGRIKVVYKMSAFVIKLIALVSMLIDHIGATVPGMPIYMRYIGRIAFPLYAFLVAEGCNHTKNINKYTVRLGLFAIVSEIPFDLAFNQFEQTDGINSLSFDFLNDTNIFYSLFLGVLCVNVYQHLKNRFDGTPFYYLMPFIVIPFALTAELLSTDYSMKAILLIFALYLAGTKWRRVLTLLVGVTLIYLPGELKLFNVMLLVFALISIIPAVLYNGEQGFKLKWLFYCFYPFHLLILAALKIAPMLTI